MIISTEVLYKIKFWFFFFVPFLNYFTSVEVVFAE